MMMEKNNKKQLSPMMDNILLKQIPKAVKSYNFNSKAARNDCLTLL